LPLGTLASVIHPKVYLCHPEVDFHLPLGTLASIIHQKVDICHPEVGFHLPLGTLASIFHPKVDLRHPEVGFLPLRSGLSFATGDFSFYIPPKGRSLPPGGGLLATQKRAFFSFIDHLKVNTTFTGVLQHFQNKLSNHKMYMKSS